MHRAQIYFEDELFQKIKQRSKMLGISISEYVRSTLKKNLEVDHDIQKIDFSEFSGIWKDRDVTIEKIRDKAWKQ